MILSVLIFGPEIRQNYFLVSRFKIGNFVGEMRESHYQFKFTTRALRALVGVGLSLDPEGKKGRLVRTGCWHLVGADKNINRKCPFIFNTCFFKKFWNLKSYFFNF